MVDNILFDVVVTDVKGKSKGVNKKKGIILHHTAGGSFEGNIRQLSQSGKVSCHFLIGEDKTAKIGKLDDIMRHTGVGTMNYDYICIEIIDKDKNFNDYQRKKVREIVYALSKDYNIPYQKIFRHSDIAPGRKIDPYDTLWNNKYKTYEEYQRCLVLDCSIEDELYLDYLEKANSNYRHYTNSDGMKDLLNKINILVRDFKGN